jgi:hypothetical protein
MRAYVPVRCSLQDEEYDSVVEFELCQDSW